MGMGEIWNIDLNREIQMPIKKVRGGYKIENVKGVSKTKKEAEIRLRAIKASQAKRGKK